MESSESHWLQILLSGSQGLGHSQPEGRGVAFFSTFIVLVYLIKKIVNPHYLRSEKLDQSFAVRWWNGVHSQADLQEGESQ